MWPFRREHRQAASGDYASEIMERAHALASGQRVESDALAAVATAAGLWERCLTMATVTPSGPALAPMNAHTLGMIGPVLGDAWGVLGADRGCERTCSSFGRGRLGCSRPIDGPAIMDLLAHVADAGRISNGDAAGERSVARPHGSKCRAAVERTFPAAHRAHNRQPRRPGPKRRCRARPRCLRGASSG